MNFHGGDIYKYKEDILDFSSNINPLGIPESFRRMIIERFEDFTRYPDIEYKEVRKKIASYINILDNRYILPGNGAVELIYKLAASSGKERAAGLRPTFSEYSRGAKTAGMEYYDIPAFKEDYAGIDAEKLLAEIKPRSLVIICNPNNPTGTLIPKNIMKGIAADLMEMDCQLIIDEAFIEFTEDYSDNSMVDLIEKYDNVTVIRAATKFFGMPGIRLGYAVSANKETIRAAKELMEPWNLNTAAVIAALSIFDDRNYIEVSREWIRSERKYLFQELQKISNLKVYPSASNFHLLKIMGNITTAAVLKEDMIKRGILIRTAEGFNGLSEFDFRLAVKDRQSNNKALEALREYFQ